MAKKPRIAITQGDPNSINYEILLRTLADARLLELFTPIIYGSAHIAGQYRRLLQLPPVPMTIINEPRQAREQNVSIINVTGEDFQLTPGKPSAEAGAAARAALTLATEHLRQGAVDALVTLPIDKNTIKSDDFPFTGHTPYLHHALNPEGPEPLMLLCSETLRVATLTQHIPLSQVSSQITGDKIVQALKTLHETLRRDFAVEDPHIAVLSLNPHIGDGGLIGDEEQTIIIPAIKQAQEECRIHAFGPYSSDGFFGAGSFSRFDATLAMYHDQALTPFKTLALSTGVNYSAGLPYVRTSPDHGTAYDIVGQGVADTQPLRSAIYAAIDILRRRRVYDEACANPLKKQYYEKGPDNVVLDLTKDDQPEDMPTPL